MTYTHSRVYIVRVVDTDDLGETDTWFVGPYGNTRAEQTADRLEAVIRNEPGEGRRECYIEPLFADDGCLSVGDYGVAS